MSFWARVLDPRRSFWALAALSAATEGTAAWLLWRAVAAQLGCYVPAWMLNRASIEACLHPIPVVGRRGWLPAAVLSVIVVSTVVLASRELVRQIVRAVQLGSRLSQLVVDEADVPAAAVRERAEIVDLDKPLCICTGPLRPKVVVSTGALDRLTDEQLGAVLAHEASHRRRRDPTRLLVARVAVAGLFFVPILRDLERASRLSTELAADQAAVRKTGLASLLGALRTIDNGNRNESGRARQIVSAMADPALLSRRIDALSGEAAPRRLRPWRSVASAVALVLVIALGITVPRSPPPPNPLHVHVVVPVHRLPAPHR